MYKVTIFFQEKREIWFLFGEKSLPLRQLINFFLLIPFINYEENFTLFGNGADALCWCLCSGRR
jgi:hypothetical protein